MHPAGVGKTGAAAADADAGGPLHLGQRLTRPSNACVHSVVRVMSSQCAGDGWDGRAQPQRGDSSAPCAPDMLGLPPRLVNSAPADLGESKPKSCLGCRDRLGECPFPERNSRASAHNILTRRCSTVEPMSLPLGAAGATRLAAAVAQAPPAPAPRCQLLEACLARASRKSAAQPFYSGP